MEFLIHKSILPAYSHIIKSRTQDYSTITLKQTAILRASVIIYSIKTNKFTLRNFSLETENLIYNMKDAFDTNHSISYLFKVFRYI